jgi:ribosomal-protein-alanine N-acetyltransferase
MNGLFSRLFVRAEPVLVEASARDSVAIAALHAASFRRGWSEQEVEGLLIERNVVTHRATAGRSLAGFIMSRIAADEAEILSVAVGRSHRDRGVAAKMLALHLRRLAGLGVRTVFLEVGEANIPAARLYASAGFQEVSRRANYYDDGSERTTAALVLRRELA